MTENSSESIGSLYSDIEIDVNSVIDCVASIKSPLILSIIKTFEKNTRTILGMLTIPLNTMDYATTIVQAEFDRYQILIAKGYTPEQISDYSNIEESVRLEIADVVVQRIAAEVKNQDIVKRKLSLMQSKIVLLLEKGTEEYQNSIQALLYSATILAWTTFETLASDLWETTVNAFPVELCKTIVKAQPSDNKEEPEGFVKKQVEIGLLAKYNFDLHKVMGTLLKNKFDFTSASGVFSAYNTTFGATQELQKLKVDENLPRLEFTRNLLVHKAGIVDERFNRLTGSMYKVGEPLFLDGATVSQLSNAAIKASCALAKFVEIWITNQESQNSK